jgi:hypothetical protein
LERTVLLCCRHFWYFSVGILACLDGYMNIAMEQTEEYVNGQLKEKYGDAFIRGNNGTATSLFLLLLLLLLLFFSFSSARCDCCFLMSYLFARRAVLYISTQKRRAPAAAATT